MLPLSPAPELVLMMRASTGLPCLRSRASSRRRGATTQKCPRRCTLIVASHSSTVRADEHAVAHEPGVVDDDVEAAEVLDGRVDRCAGAVPVRRRRRRWRRPRPPGRADLVDDRPAPSPCRGLRRAERRAEVVHDDLRALARKRERVRAPEPAARAGDDDDASLADT